MNRPARTKSKARKESTQLRNKFLNLDFRDDLEKQPPKPLIENAGATGKTLEQALADFRLGLHNKRKRLQEQHNAEKAIGAPRVIVRTIKDVIVNRILERKASALNRRQLNRLPVGELQAHLPRFDWRDLGIVPLVRDQLKCNSCWAITATQAFEASLTRQLTNFSLNEEEEDSEYFSVPWVVLNVRSTKDCVPPRGCNLGRVETAFNYYFKHGIAVSEIILNSVRLDQQDQPDPPTFDWRNRDAKLPERHCSDKAATRVKIIGWDYVHRNAWKIPPKKTLKTALLEHGPLVVLMSTVGLRDYSARRMVDRSVEIGSNPGSGIVFKSESVSGGLLVCVPSKYMKKQMDENSGEESFNLNAGSDGDKHFHFDPPAAGIFKTGEHLRKAPADLSVGTFREHDLHKLTDLTIENFEQIYDRETDNFIFHFPGNNDVKLAQDPLTDNFYLRFPANSETKLEPHNNVELTMTLPNRFPEDLDPVFEANTELPVNHAVLLVGWDDGKKAWIIQNSWGDNWGYACNYYGGDGKGYAYVRYGTLGQYATWVEADLLEERFRKPSEHGGDGGGARAVSWSGKPFLPTEAGE